MNTLIKQLMLDAGYAAPEIADRAQKLSQLIVSECLKTLQAQKLQIHEESDNIDWLDLNWNGCIDHCAENIKQTFGLTEE